MNTASHFYSVYDAAVTISAFLERGSRMRFIVGLVISFAVGVGCRYFDIPVGSPAVIPGALLVLAMTMGYSSTNKILNRRSKLATTSHLCGGPSGAPAAPLSVGIGDAVLSRPNAAICSATSECDDRILKAR